MFRILFGLSMDYEVFLVSHVQQGHQCTAWNEDSVTEWVERAGHVLENRLPPAGMP